MPSNPKTIPSCMTVHDNVAVAVIVSKIWAFRLFSLNVCHWHRDTKVGQGHSSVKRPILLYAN